MALYRPLSNDPRDNVIKSTLGHEFMFYDTLKEYVGEYHVYPNGAIYSEPTYDPKRSMPLIPYISTLDHPNNLTFLKLSARLYNEFLAPEYYFVTLTPAHYQQGFFFRYVIQKKNESKKIWEVDVNQYKQVNRLNKPGINGFIYNRAQFKWRLTGKREDVVKDNRKTIIELLPKFPGILDYFNDPAEFIQIHPTTETEAEGLFTAGGQFVTEEGKDYVGSYHIHPVYGPMIGAKHINQPHGKLAGVGTTFGDQSSY